MSKLDDVPAVRFTLSGARSEPFGSEQRPLEYRGTKFLFNIDQLVVQWHGKECEQRSEHSKIGTPKDREGHGNQRAWAGEIKGSGADTIIKEGDEKR